MPFFNKKQTEKTDITNETKLIVNAMALQFRDVVTRALGISHKGERDLYEIYGYPADYGIALGRGLLARQGVGARVITGQPKTCWRDGFTVEVNEKEVLTDELKTLKKLGLFSRLERADILNRIGTFSILFVGVPDGAGSASEPLKKVMGDGLSGVYFKPFAEDGITITGRETDITSPRYGMPTMYTLQAKDMGQGGEVVLNNVHYSRVVHIAECLLDSDVEGVPYIAPIYNAILDIEKARGGASEAYFRNARGKTGVEVDPEFGGELLSNETAFKKYQKAAKSFVNDWQDQFIALGAKLTNITTPHASPKDTLDACYKEVASYTGEPLRVLTGEGGGQLAGSEDRAAFNSIVNLRQKQKCALWAGAVLEILNESGVITLPDGWEIAWPQLNPLTEQDEAELNNKKADTLTKVTSAKSSMAGDGIDIKSAFAALGLEDVKVEEVEIEPEPMDDTEEGQTTEAN